MDMWAWQYCLDSAYNSKLKHQEASKQVNKSTNPVAQKGLKFFKKEAQLIWGCLFPGAPAPQSFETCSANCPDHFSAPPGHAGT